MASTGEQAWRPLEKTFAVIKPDAVRAGSTSAILKAAEDAGFVVVCSKETRLSPDRAGDSTPSIAESTSSPGSWSS